MRSTPSWAKVPRTVPVGQFGMCRANIGVSDQLRRMTASSCGDVTAAEPEVRNIVTWPLSPCTTES